MRNADAGLFVLFFRSLEDVPTPAGDLDRARAVHFKPLAQFLDVNFEGVRQSLVSLTPDGLGDPSGSQRITEVVHPSSATAFSGAGIALDTGEDDVARKRKQGHSPA